MEFPGQPEQPFQISLIKGDFQISHIPPLLADLLREIPNWNTNFPEDSVARLYPQPTEDPLDEELRRDWAAYTHASLAEYFQSCRDMVSSDLVKMTLEKHAKLFYLIIPFSHADAWINALTQARLAIATKLDLKEEELSEKIQPNLTTKRGSSIFQVNFYGILTHYFVEALEE